MKIPDKILDELAEEYLLLPESIKERFVFEAYLYLHKDYIHEQHIKLNKELINERQMQCYD